MLIETKFNIGDDVYWVKDGVIYRGEVNGLYINFANTLIYNVRAYQWRHPEPGATWELDAYSNAEDELTEESVFATEEELLSMGETYLLETLIKAKKDVLRDLNIGLDRDVDDKRCLERNITAKKDSIEKLEKLISELERKLKDGNKT